MRTPGRPVYLRELVVVNFRSAVMSEDIRRWKSETANIGVAESCARQLWFGLQDDFSAFPARGRSGIDFYEGPDAYRFLLKLYCGLESERLCEDSIRGQICGGWEKFQTDNPHKRKAIDTILQDIKADFRFINAAVLENHKPQRHEISARDLSGQAKGDKVLLIGSLNRNGNLSSFSEGLVRVIGNKRPGRVSQITLTHPDMKVLHALHDYVSGLKCRGILDVHVKHAAFKDLSKAVESADRVYVDIPMNSLPEAEEIIIMTWQTRIYTGNTLTHLRGDPNAMGVSSPVWKGAALDDYISPELIREDMAGRARNNTAVVSQALRAIEYCATMRQKGTAPSVAKVRTYISELCADSAFTAPKIV